MTEQEAMKKARERWGELGGVQMHPGPAPFWVGVYSQIIDFWPKACGESWQDAFDKADKFERANR